MRRRTVLGTGAAAFMAGVAPWNSAAADRIDAQAALMFRMISATRHAIGLPGLEIQPDLVRVARRQIDCMHRQHRTVHVDDNGNDPVERARLAGYPGQILGETLAATHDGPAGTVDAWLKETATRSVLLDPRARDAGLFGSRDKTGLVWWDLLVGA